MNLIVVNGFAEKKGIDFNKTFYSIVKITLIRTILNLVATEGLHLE